METHKSSVLIIGAGGAGIRCAIELKASGFDDVTILGNRKFNDSHTIWAAGGINAALGTMDPDDNELIHSFDTYEEGHFINNPKLVETLTKYAPEAISDLEKFGANFHKESDGRLTQRFFGAHSYRRTCFSGDETGREIIRVLVNEAKKLNLNYIEGVDILRLVQDDNRVYGAIGIKDEKIIEFKSDIVVVATGGASNLFKRSSSRKDENFGDGIAMGLRAGAKIGDMELFQFHPTGLIWPLEMEGELVTEAVRAEGGILKNSLGERIMEKYDPEKLELSTRDVVARANYMEIQAGRGTHRGGVFLDVSSKSKDYILDRLPHMYRMLLEYNNIDITKEPMEVAPTAHYTMGGIFFNDTNYETNVSGLYAIGECTMGVHGANRLGGNSLAEILVFGKLVAKEIVKNTISRKENNVAFERTHNEINEYNKNGDINAVEMIQNVREIMWDCVGIIRTQSKLELGLEKLREIKQRINDKKIENSKNFSENLILKNRLENILLLSEITTLGAIERKESRGAHYREDYLQRDNKYQKSFLFKMHNNALKMEEFISPKPSKELSDMLKSHTKTKNYTHLE